MDAAAITLHPDEVAVLAGARAAGAAADGPYHRCSDLLAAVDGSVAHPFRLLRLLAAEWSLGVPLLWFHGNSGDVDDDGPGPNLVEAKLSPMGEAALDDPAVGSLAALINGDLHVGGRRPPFHPEAVLAAVRLLAGDATASDRAVAEVLGPPWFVRDPDVGVGDLPALLAGRSTQVAARCRVAADGSERIVCSHLPPVSHAVACETLESIGGGSGWSVRRVEDRSFGPIPEAFSVVIDLGAGSSVARAIEDLSNHPALSVRWDASFGGPVVPVLRALAASLADHGRPARLDHVEALVRARPPVQAWLHGS